MIDEEVSSILEEQYVRAKKILSENQDKLVKLAELLLEKEVIFKEDLELIFGKRPFEKEEEEKTVKTEKPSEPESKITDTTTPSEGTASTDDSASSNGEKTPDFA